MENKVLTYINGNADLKALFKIYISSCISLNLPYHNVNHTFKMMYHIINLYENREQYNISISNYDLMIMLIAAMYHDYNHSAGIYSDAQNVQTAINAVDNALQDVLDRTYEVGNDMYIDMFRDISSLIEATEYPYTKPKDKLTIAQNIIRELDIISQFDTDFFCHTLCGLKNEMHIQDWKVVISKYINFIKETLYSKEIALQYTKDYIQNNGNRIADTLELLTNIIG